MTAVACSILLFSSATVIVAAGVLKNVLLVMGERQVFVPFELNRSIWNRIVVVFSAVEIFLGVAFLAGLFSTEVEVFLLIGLGLTVTIYGVMSIRQIGDCGCGIGAASDVRWLTARNLMIFGAGFSGLVWGASADKWGDFESTQQHVLFIALGIFPLGIILGKWLVVTMQSAKT